VETVVGDLRDAGALQAACAGVRTVISTVTVIKSQRPEDTFDAVDDAGQHNLIEAARACGVEHFIFISVTGGVEIPSPIMKAKRRTEERLRASGMAYTILRPTFFMDIWLSPLLGFDHADQKARILGDGKQRISYIAAGDVARFAVACVNNPAAHDRMIELGGPHALTPLEAVKIFEKLSGKPYELEFVPAEALRAQYEAATHPTQKTFTGLMLGGTTDDVIPMEATAGEFGVMPTSLEAFAPRLLGAPALH
jgi:NADH dehydrogenase